jgi:hypothetical protein
MKNSLLVLGAAILLALWHENKHVEASDDETRFAPEFPTQEASRWINSKPLKMVGNGENGLRGKVVLLNVWTFM